MARLRPPVAPQNFSIRFTRQRPVRWTETLIRPVSHCEITFGDKVGVGCSYCDAGEAERIWQGASSSGAGDFLSRQEEVADSLQERVAKSLEAISGTAGPAIWNNPLANNEPVASAKDNSSTSGDDASLFISSSYNCRNPDAAAVISGIDTALWQLQAQLQGVELAELLSAAWSSENGATPFRGFSRQNQGRGGPVAYCTVEIPFSFDPEEAIGLLAAKLERLMRCYHLKAFKLFVGPPFGLFDNKVGVGEVPVVQVDHTARQRQRQHEPAPTPPIKMGGASAVDALFPPDVQLAWARQVFHGARRIVGPDIHLFVDLMGFQEEWQTGSEQVFFVETLMRQVFEPVGIGFCEEPFAPNALEDYVAFGLRDEQHQNTNRQSCEKIAIAGCESLIGVEAFRPWMTAPARRHSPSFNYPRPPVQLFQPDTCVAGGVSVVLRLAKMWEEEERKAAERQKRRVVGSPVKQSHQSGSSRVNLQDYERNQPKNTSPAPPAPAEPDSPCSFSPRRTSDGQFAFPQLRGILPHSFATAKAWETDFELVQWLSLSSGSNMPPLGPNLIELPEHLLEELLAEEKGGRFQIDPGSGRCSYLVK
ncbi:unnamed protein product [Amoebophrya sp. A120]|nr:unnamed protein product [Amoebophrya sp. A120]|eukprot:GSA120T00000254001.1